MSDINPKELRSAFGTFMTGVTVVTTNTTDTENPDGVNIGFTANSFTSVSLDPPLLSVCLAKSMSCCESFEKCTHFAINILAEAQEDISNLFASYKGDRFAKVGWQANEFGTPLIDGVTTSFSCSNYQQIDAGDHMILLGKIESFSSTGHEGLGYSNQGYFSLGLERGAVEPPTSMRKFKVGVIVESDGEILLQQTDSGLEPPYIEVENRTGALGAISKYVQSKGLDVEFGPVYSIFDNQKTGDYSVYFLANSASQQNTPLGSFYGVDKLVELPLSSQYLKDMLSRYALETEVGVFGLYLGDEDEGDVHTL